MSWVGFSENLFFSTKLSHGSILSFSFHMYGSPRTQVSYLVCYAYCLLNGLKPEVKSIELNYQVVRASHNGWAVGSTW